VDLTGGGGGEPLVLVLDAGSGLLLGERVGGVLGSVRSVGVDAWGRVVVGGQDLVNGGSLLAGLSLRAGTGPGMGATMVVEERWVHRGLP